MSANAAALRLLAAYTSRADGEGCFTLDAPMMAERFAITVRSVKSLAARLADGGAIERCGVRGHYRITGKPYQSSSTAQFVRDPIPPRDRPAEDAYREQQAVPAVDEPCSYRGARAAGIEPTIHMLRYRSLGPLIADIAISLARVPSLERPLPDIGP